MKIITYTIEFFIPMFEDIFFIFCLNDENNCTSVDTSRNLADSINTRLSVLLLMCRDSYEMNRFPIP